MKTLITAILLVVAITAQADDRRKHEQREKHEHHNYILERQQAYQVQGVRTSRLIIGKREIDIYPNGMMFEKNNHVGIKK